ncbi:hypothetical protein [Cupriavidus alkaliphilus]|uniref:hypothetical protein n=1 Tax=Cupriavidus alkaliphilus TaxID=942866 RepID=UPI001617AECB|nr:hypothetical protein [Cupriavidus alkaliphilus]MBB3012021.1 hypothetical protein [Cupriavidus alkaliphilus]
MNTDEDTPDSFFIFVKKDNFVAMNNYNVGIFESSAISGLRYSQEAIELYVQGRANFLPGAGWPAVSPYAASGHWNSPLETALEIHRLNNFPFMPSRLSAVYAFGDRENSAKAAAKYGWDMSTLKEFKLHPFALTRIARLNMEHISFARSIRPETLPGKEALMNAYWQGVGEMQYELHYDTGERAHHTVDAIWEYLVDGTLTRADRPQPGLGS